MINNGVLNDISMNNLIKYIFISNNITNEISYLIIK